MRTKKTARNTGITLIALVVTIVVLLILAAITINLVLSDDGIIKKTEEAKEKHLQGEQNDLEAIDKAGELIDQYLSGKTNKDDEPREKIADLMGKPADSNKNTPAEDEYGNKITIPAGFTIVPDTEENDVEYNYTGKTTPEGSKIPSVQDGIVIQDGEGNQFVWIPVGEIKNKKGDIVHGETSTITLGRYEDFTVKTDADGKKYYQPKQTVLQYKKEEGSTQTDLEYQDIYKIEIDSAYYMELTEKLEEKSEIAENIENFLKSATAKGGYYLARYEASEGTNKKPMSKANQNPWVNETQPNMATYARSMYGTSDPMKSDLVNSYAWDTAIIFIQMYSERNSDYANQETKKFGTPLATGTTGDCVCNIHDMSSNCYEISTEYSTGENEVGGEVILANCVHRGSSCIHGTMTTASRANWEEAAWSSVHSFRVLCYVR